MEDLDRAAAKVLRDLALQDLGAEPGPTTAMVEIEKPNLKFGFIKLTDCAPLVIAFEKGYFHD